MRFSLTKEATSRLSDLKFDKSETVTSWGGKATSRYSENHSIQIADLSWERVTIGESDYSGPATDGKFGPNLFSGKIVAIDFDTCTISLHDKLPEIDAAFQRLDLIVKNDLMFIEGALQIGDRQYKQKFMIHSGFGGTLLLDDEFVSTNKLAEQLTTTSVTELKDSFGNIVKTRNVVLPSMRFGSFRLDGVSVGLFDAALGKQKRSLLGGNILKKYPHRLQLEGSAHLLEAQQALRQHLTNGCLVAATSAMLTDDCCDQVWCPRNQAIPKCGSIDRIGGRVVNFAPRAGSRPREDASALYVGSIGWYARRLAEQPNPRDRALPCEFESAPLL